MIARELDEDDEVPLEQEVPFIGLALTFTAAPHPIVLFLAEGVDSDKPGDPELIGWQRRLIIAVPPKTRRRRSSGHVRCAG